MDKLDEIYDIYVQSLFTENFDQIILKYKNNNYEWKKFEKIFRQMYKLIIDSKNEKNLITNYHMFILLYLNYTNYLKYSQNSDFNNSEIYNIINKIKFNKHILKKILAYTPNTNIKKIIKITNPFVNLKLNKFKNEEYLEKFITEYLLNSKQMEKLSEMSNDNYKKSLNILIFRNMISIKNKYNNYHDFFIKNIINFNDLNFFLDFDSFINKIPQWKKILNFRTKNSDFEINVNIIDVIKFLLTKISKLSIENNSDKFILTNTKYGGKLVICFDPNIQSTEFNNYQINYSLMHFGLEELKNFNFLKKTSTFIEIKLASKNIKDLSSLLDIIHLLTISFKILESYPNDIYECIYPVEYTNYYFLSFCMFLEFVKPHIKKSLGINKFIIDLIKYFYIYSYYDYYFYYSKNLFETIISNYSYKNNIFEEFINNLKNTLKIPKELFSYPPFFNIEDDLNSSLFYSFEIPNYFKLFDLINAIAYVFSKDYYSVNNKDIDLIELIKKNFYIIDVESSNNKKENNISLSESLIHTGISDKPKKSVKNKYSSEDETNSSTTLNYTSSNENQSESNDDLKSRLNIDQISNMTKQNKKLIQNTNTYIELNIENSINCNLNTEIN